MATVRTAPNEVSVDGIIYAFTDAEVADAFESCVATTGDVDHCMKEQPVLHFRAAETGRPVSTAEGALDNWDGEGGQNKALDQARGGGIGQARRHGDL